MKRHNFQGKKIVSHLKNKKIDKYIGIIIKDLSYPFYHAIVLGAREYASKKGYYVIIMSSDNDYEYEKKLLCKFSAQDINGMIIAPVLEKEAEIEHILNLKTLNYPFVLLEDVKGIYANIVAIDNVEAIKQAVKYLIDNGHRKIVYFAGPLQFSQSRERIEGFIRAFSESTLVFNEEMITSIGSQYDESFNNTIKFFKNKNKRNYPTAIICFNDHQAFAVMHALKDMNIKVPDDISIIGHDDIYYAKNYPVPLTTIKAPLNEIGMKAAEILIRNIESLKVLSVERVIFSTKLIVRETTKKINSAYL
jgi:LacI family transcriptional regulator